MNHSSFWKGKSVLITGVSGTVGGEVLRQLIGESPSEIIGIDNNESELFFLTEEYRERDNVKLFLGDIRDPEKLIRKSRGVDCIIHTAALKHVILCEQTPRDPVQTNILGTQNVIDAALANGVERVIFTSSDKAVNPTNVMGTTKLMGERLITAANAHRRNGGALFSSTRFGNVLGSRGSVMPLFRRQIAAGGPVTLTELEMTRFIMTLSDAVKLVMNSAPLRGSRHLSSASTCRSKRLQVTCPKDQMTALTSLPVNWPRRSTSLRSPSTAWLTPSMLSWARSRGGLTTNAFPTPVGCAC